MRRNLKKLMAVLLAVTMTVSTVASPALAADGLAAGSDFQDEFVIVEETLPGDTMEEAGEVPTSGEGSETSLQEEAGPVLEIVQDTPDGNETPVSEEPELFFEIEDEEEQTNSGDTEETETETEEIPDGDEPFHDESIFSSDEVKDLDLLREENGIAPIAEGELYYEGDFSYSLYNDEDGTLKAAIESYTGSNAVVTIPSIIGGNKVGAIGDFAFESSYDLTGIIIPEGVTEIRDYAFAKCFLESIALPVSLKKVESMAFYTASLRYVHYAGDEEDWAGIEINGGENGGNQALVKSDDAPVRVRIYRSKDIERFTYEVPGTNAVLTCSNGENISIIQCNQDASGALTIPAEINGKQVVDICSGAFYQCSKLQKISIPSSIMRVGNHTFFRCSSLVSAEFAGKINYIGDYAFEDCDNLASVEHQGGVAYIGDSAFSGCNNLSALGSLDGLIYIGEWTFVYCYKLTEMELPDTVTHIGSHAFAHCYSLRKMVLPSGITEISEGLFLDCKSLLNIEMQGNVVLIGESAFYECSALTGIQIPESVNQIGAWAFRDCVSLERVVLPQNLKEIKTSLFSGCSKLIDVEIPETVTSIEDSAFSDCENLTGLVLPDGITSIGYGAFTRCSSLQKIVLPKNVTEIKGGSFENCKKLEDVQILGDVLTIGDSAFYGCQGLHSISIPESVTSIGQSAFGKCISLRTVILPRNVTEIKEALFFDCTSLQNVDIRGQISSIGGAAFRNCESLGSIFLPESVQQIGSNAFENCRFLDHITLPESVTQIGEGAFYGCASLVSMILPKNLTSISYVTFRDCSSLSILYIPESVTSISEDLAELTELVLNVEAGSYAEEFARMHGMKFTYGNSLDSGTINVFLDPEDEWDAYEGMLLKLNCGEKCYSQKIQTKHSYRFTSLPVDSVCSVFLQNAYGDILAEQKNIIAKKGEQTITLSQSMLVGSMELCVLDENRQAVSEQVGIEWYNENGSLYGSGATLTGVPEGKTIISRVRLNETLGKEYVTPEEQRWTVSAGKNSNTIQLKPYGKHMLSGSIAEEQGALSGASVAIVQNLNNKYRVSQTVLTGKDGTFQTEIYSADAELTVSADGYLPQKVLLEMSEKEQNLGQILMTPVNGCGLLLQIGYKKAAQNGQTETEQILFQWDDLDFQIDNMTTGHTALSYIRQKGELVITEGVSPGDHLRVTVSSLSADFVPAECEVVADEYGDGEVSMSLVQRGSVFSACDYGGNTAVRICVYDSKDGSLAWTGLLEGKTLQSGKLQQGDYTVIGIGEGKFLTYPESLESMKKIGYVEGTDYSAKKVSVTDGVITAVDLGTIPYFDEERFYYTRQDQTLFQTNKTDVIVGKSFTVRAKAQWKEEYQNRVSDIKWIFEIPKGCAYVNGTLSADGTPCSGAELGESRITVPVEDVSSLIRLCLMATEQGTYRVSGFLQFALDGEEILQPVSTIEVKAGEMSFDVCERTNNKVVCASGTAPELAEIQIYDNDVLVGTTASNSLGKWWTEFELYQPYTYSKHRIYVSVITREGVSFRTETKELVYRYSLSPVSVKLVKMGLKMGHAGEGFIEFKFEGKKSEEFVSYSFNPGYPTFTFQIIFNGEDLSTLENVQLDVLCSDGSTRTLYPVKNEKDGTWVTSEDFSASCLPLNVSVRYDYDAGTVISREQISDETAKWESLQNDIGDVTQLWEHLEMEESAEISEKLINMGAISREQYDAYLQQEQQLKKALEDYNAIQDSLKQSADALKKAADDLGKVTVTDGRVHVSTPLGDIDFVKDPNMSKESLAEQGYVPVTGVGVHVSIPLGDTDFIKASNMSKESLAEQGYVKVPSDSGEPWYVNQDPYKPSVADPATGTRVDITPNLPIDYSDSKGPGIDIETINDAANHLGLYGALAADKGLTDFLDKSAEATKELIAAAEESAKMNGAAANVAERWLEEYEDADAAQGWRDLRKDALKNQKEQLAKAESLKNKLRVTEKASKALGAIGIGVEIASGLNFFNTNMAKINQIEKSTGSAAVKALCKQLRYQLWAYMAYLTCGVAFDVYAMFNPGIKVLSWAVMGLRVGFETGFEIGFAETVRELEAKVGEGKPQYAQKSRNDNLGATVDPSGYVYEAVPSNRLPGVTATCYEKVTKYDQYEEAYEEVEFWEASKYGQNNPLITDAAGEYAWDVPDGKWQIKYEKKGYETAYSAWLDVPPPRFDVNIGLVSYEPPTVSKVQATPKGVDIVFSKYMKVGSLTDFSVRVQLDGRMIKGSVEPLDGEENPEKAGELLASRVRFVPEEKLTEGEELTITVSNTACSYAGVPLAAKAIQKVTVNVLPETLAADAQITLDLNGSGTITVQAKPASAAAGKKIEVLNPESMIYSADTAELMMDESGKAVFTVHALMPGQSEITFQMAGTDLIARTRVTVSLPAVAAPAASVASGAVEKGTRITLSCSTPGANIYYTLDGSDPTMSSTRQRYSGNAVVIEKDCVLQAAAMREGMSNSKITRCEYTIKKEAQECESGKHKWVWVVDKAATCGAAGSRHQECSVCKKVGKSQKISATGKHSWGAYKVTKKATVMKAGTKTRTCKVCKAKETRTIAKLAPKIKLTVKKLPLQVKKSVNLKQIVTGMANGDVIKSWKTSNKKIAAVDQKGKVTGKKVGNAKITVTLKSGISASVTVTVKKAAVATTKIGNIPKTLTIKKGKKATLSPKITPISSLQKVKYKTSNKKVATVSQKGVITAKSVGKAKITVISGNKKVVVTVNVKKK